MQLRNHSLARLVRIAFGTVALALAAGAATAGTRCDPPRPDGVQRCVSGLPASLLGGIQQNQASGDWSWAASISMVLRRFGVSVAQEAVAQAHPGRAENVPVTPDTLAKVFNRTWLDTEGRQLEGSLSPLPTWRRADGIGAPEVLAELEEGRPLLLWHERQTMVLVQLVYERIPGAGAFSHQQMRIVRAVVLDPQAPAILRSLKPAERHPQYLARVAITNGPHMEASAHYFPANAQEPPTGYAAMQR